MTCYYCGCTAHPRDLRPYGPGGADICSRCGTSPEHREATKNAFNALFDAAAEIGDGVVVLTDRGPEPYIPDAA